MRSRQRSSRPPTPSLRIFLLKRHSCRIPSFSERRRVPSFRFLTRFPAKRLGNLRPAAPPISRSSRVLRNFVGSHWLRIRTQPNVFIPLWVPKGARLMDKKIAGLLGAVGALATLDTAQATNAVDPTTVMQAQSYADLLNPIPNAAATLKAVDEAGGNGRMRIAENAHHHHHHHHQQRRRHHHHHHHHSM
jgi:hypothetical protein